MKITSSFSSCVAFALLAVASLQAHTVTGSGTEHTIPVWTRSSKLGDSVISESGTGVRVKGTVEGTSTSPSGDGVVGTSTKGSGVYGNSEGHGIYGTSDNGLGVYGTSKSNVGVSGESEDSYGVEGSSDSSSGVYGISVSKIGVKGEIKMRRYCW